MGEKMEAIKAEFKKVIWPTQQTVAKETVACVLTGVGMALVLAILDTVIKFGLNFIL